jgi:hypothetical protein
MERYLDLDHIADHNSNTILARATSDAGDEYVPVLQRFRERRVRQTSVEVAEIRDVILTRL